MRWIPGTFFRQALWFCCIVLQALLVPQLANASPGSQQVASQPTARSVELRGRVTAWEGEPVPATVRVYATETLYEQLSREVDGRALKPLASTRPDSRGHFAMRFETASEFVRLEIRPDADRKREILLPVRSVRIDVPALNLYRRGAAEAQKRSAVRVLDRERQPLADTLLFETSHHYLFANGRPAWHGSPRRLLTDTEGGLQISRASQRLLGGSPFPNGAVAVTVQDAVTPGVERLHVSVSDADGQPVPGALVLWNLGAPACGRTDEVGEIDVGVVPAARLTALTEDGRWGQIEVPARPQRALEIRVERHSVEALPTGHLVGPRNSVDSQRLLSFARSRGGLFSIVTFPEGREARGVSLASFLEGGEALTLESKTRIWTLDATVVTTDAQGRSRPVKDAVAMSTYRGWSYSGDDGTLRFDNLKGNSPLAIQAPGFAPVLIDVAPQSDPLRIEMRPGGTGFGTVTDLQGQPVEGALVALHVIEGARPKDLSTTTDAAGNFELGGLARGLSTLKVEARGFAPATVRGIETTDDGDFEIGIVALQPGAELRGVVLDEQGDPLSGVAVHFATSPGLRRLDASYTIYTRRSGGRPLAFHDPKLQTDAKGRFVLQDLLPQETLRLDLTKRGYLPLGVPIELPVEDEVELRLESAATLIGTVTFGNGDPAEGVTIVLQREDGPGAQTGPRGSKTVSTNPAGSYEFPSLAAGTYRLTARALGLAIDIPEEPFSLVAGRTKQVDLTIGDGAAVSGKVYYSDGEPAARVRVRLAGQVGVTGNDGTYQLDGVRTGLQTFRVATWLDVRTEFDVEVLPGTNVIDAEVGGFALTGQVLHADGQGAAGARVNARGAGTIADENGEFRIQGAASGRVPVLASLGDQRASVEVVVPEEANSIVLTLEDRSVGAVQGTILGLDTDEMAQVELAAIGDGFHRGPQPDFEGNFRFKRLRPGDWSIQARLASGNRQESQAVTVAADETAEVLLDFGREGESLEVTVASDSRPMSNVGLALESLGTDGSPQTATYGRSDYSGVARFDQLKPGRYRVSPTEPGGSQYLWREVEVLGQETLTLDLRPARLGGSIAGPTGERVALRLVHGTGQTFEQQIVLPGSYSFGVEKGSYRLEIERRGSEPESFPVQLTGASTRLDLSVGEAPP